MGLLCEVSGFIDTVLAKDPSIELWHGITNNFYLVMFAMQAAPGMVYVRIRCRRMPPGLFVVHRLYGVETSDDWHRAAGFNYEGIMTYDEFVACIPEV